MAVRTPQARTRRPDRELVTAGPAPTHGLRRLVVTRVDRRPAGPALSLPRQPHNSRSAVLAGWSVSAHFHDVEPDHKDLDARGYSGGDEPFQIPINRDGGIRDLLIEAASATRRLDAVIRESIARVARHTYSRHEDRA